MYRKVILIVFIAVVAAFAINGLIDRKTVTTSSEKAYQAYLKGQDFASRLYHKEAVQEYEKAVKIDTNFAMAWARVAVYYKDADKKELYQKARSRALSLIPNVKDSEKLMINFLISRSDGNFNDANKYSAELVEKYGNSFNALEIAAGQALERREYDKCIGVVDKMLKINPDYALGYNWLGYSYYYKGEYDKSLENLDKYSQLAPDQANPRDSYGEILLNLGRYDEALTQFRKADSIKAGLDFVMMHLAQTYYAKGMYRDALGAYMKAKEYTMNSMTRYGMDISIAFCYKKLGQMNKTIDLMNEVISREPQFADAHAVLGYCAALTDNIAEAENQLRIAKSIVDTMKADNPEAKSNRLTVVNFVQGAIDMAKGDYKSSIANYQTFLNSSQYPVKLNYLEFIFEVYSRAKMPDSIISLTAEAFKYNPNCAECYLALADAYSMKGQKVDQKNALQKALNILKDADDGVPYIEKAKMELAFLTSNKL